MTTLNSVVPEPLTLVPLSVGSDLGLGFSTIIFSGIASFSLAFNTVFADFIFALSSFIFIISPSLGSSICSNSVNSATRSRLIALITSLFSSLIFFHEKLVGAVDLVAEVALTTGAAFSLFKNSSKDLGDFPSFPASQPIFLSESILSLNADISSANCCSSHLTLFKNAS